MATQQNGQTHSNDCFGKLPRNCLSVFDHFVGLALEGFREPFMRGYGWIINIFTNLRLAWNKAFVIKIHKNKSLILNQVKDLRRDFSAKIVHGI